MIPGAIIYINNNYSPSALEAVQKQLFINETITAEEFDNRVSLDPNYGDLVRNFNRRVLVIRSLDDLTNRELADLVINVKLALVYVEENKFGPPTKAIPINNFYFNKLISGC